LGGKQGFGVQLVESNPHILESGWICGSSYFNRLSALQNQIFL